MSRLPVIKEEIAELITTHGRQVFLRRKYSRKCSCWNIESREGDRECPHCSGLGYSYTDYKVWAFKRITTGPTSASYRAAQRDAGIVHVDEGIFYFETVTQTPANASVGDWIVECVTDTDGALVQPYKIQRAWAINHVVDYREDHGQLAYYAAYVRRIALGK